MSSAPAPVTPRRRWKRLLFALGAALVVGGVALKWGAIRTTWERNQGLQAAQAGDFERAEPLLRGVLERRPDDRDVIEALARGYAKAGDARAEPLLERWSESRPDQAEPLRTRLDFHRKRKQWEKAYADSQQLLKLRPGDAELRQTVMKLAFSTGHFAEAEELCREGLRQQPDDTQLLSLLAEIRRARGDAAGAAAILDRILAAQPHNTPALLARGTLYNEAGEPEKAIPLLREVLRSDPQRQRTTGYQLSLALEQVGRTDEARQVMVDVRRRQDVEVYRDAIQTQPDNLDLQVRLAKLLLAEGFVQDGLGLLQAVLNRNPHFRPAHVALADYYERLGDAARAAEHRQQAARQP